MPLLLWLKSGVKRSKQLLRLAGRLCPREMSANDNAELKGPWRLLLMPGCRASDPYYKSCGYSCSLLELLLSLNKTPRKHKLYYADMLQKWIQLLILHKFVLSPGCCAFVHNRKKNSNYRVFKVIYEHYFTIITNNSAMLVSIIIIPIL